MNIADLIGTLVLVFAAFSGFKKGFVKAISDAIGGIIALMVAYQYSSVFAHYLPLPFPWNTLGVFFLLTLLLIILFKLISRLIHNFLDITLILGIFNRLMGALLYVGFSYILFSFLYWVLIQYSIIAPSAEFAESRFLNLCQFIFPVWENFTPITLPRLSSFG